MSLDGGKSKRVALPEILMRQDHESWVVTLALGGVGRGRVRCYVEYSA